MIILKYICIIIFFIIIFKLINTKETLRELGTLSSLNSASLDEIETLGLGKSRSKAFRRHLLKELKKRIPPNSIAPGNRCTKDMHIQCKGDSACYPRDAGQTPICLAGVDGVLAPGDRSKGQPSRKGTYVDEWGCVWECGEDGVAGEVKGPPLADWSALPSFSPPWEVIQRADWDAANRAQQKNLAGQNKFLVPVCRFHGHRNNIGRICQNKGLVLTVSRIGRGILIINYL